MTQPTLEDALEARDQAIAQAGQHADDQWRDTAHTVVRELANAGVPFTTDHVWAVLDDLDATTHEPRALGAVIQQASRAGVIRPTGRWVKSTRGVNHAREIKEWSAA